MNWQGRRRSGNIDDRRGRGRGLAIGGIGGIGGVLLLVLYLLMGGNPTDLPTDRQGGAAGYAAGPERQLSEEERELGDFVAVVLASTEDVWQARFRAAGQEYREPTLVLFTGQVESACGLAGAAVGPFYCPGDENLYIDLDFFADMQRELGAPGDFALAYVIAHEVGHHLQNLMGIMEQVDAQRSGLSGQAANQLSVRLELQADFLAGVWAHEARQSVGFLDAADIEEGLNAASAVGDDRIMRRTQGRVVPDAFTHGTSEQRVRWFRRGLEGGDLGEGDTFAAERL